MNQLKNERYLAKRRFTCPSCKKKLRNRLELRKHELQHKSITDQMTPADFEYVLVKAPKAFLRNVRSYLKETGNPENFNEFVLESLRQRILTLSGNKRILDTSKNP